MLIWEAKDADETVLRVMDFADRLGADYISSATFSVVSGGITLSGSEHDGGSLASVLVTGGTNATRCKVLCSITTDDGQTIQQTATILIRAR